MEILFQKYKGIHPGLVLDRELSKRHVKKGPFAISIGEYPQIINEITKGRRGLTAPLSLKIDKYLGIEVGTMFLLQAHFELNAAKAKASIRPNLSLLRDLLFWDTDINKIDWEKQYKAVIKRVFERGNDEERKEILRFYGEARVRAVISDTEEQSPLMERARIK